MSIRIVLLLFAPLLWNCAHKSKEAQTAPFYFEKAKNYKKKGDYTKALENLMQIRQKFFSSPYNRKALLMTADIYFEQEKYQQSAQTYKKYQSLYPQKKDYVLYQLGLSYKNQLPRRSEHDLSLAQPGLKAFDQLLALKPSSPYKQKALKARQEIEDKKAERELKTALFFKTQGWRKASLKRIQYFIKHYPKSPLLAKALLTGFKLSQKLKLDPEPFKKRLLKEFPQSHEVRSLNESPSFFSVIKQKIL